MARTANDTVIDILLNDLNKMQKRLDRSEDAVASGLLPPDTLKYHLETVTFYRAESSKLRSTLVTLSSGESAATYTPPDRTARAGSGASAGDDHDASL
jgi:hypothetical protein